MAKKSSTVGLNKNRRVDWNMIENLSLVGFVNNSGLHGKVIAQHCGGMSVGQVYNRCKKLGIKITDYRNGLTDSAKVVIKRFSVSTMKPQILKEITGQLPKGL
ncbi:MAG: hypothetical protein PHH82_04805 [Candidatus ainarchaeum sp.]|nr:hypothetical protein [Candidatus ainarchaeum sp.]